MGKGGILLSGCIAILLKIHGSTLKYKIAAQNRAQNQVNNALLAKRKISISNNSLGYMEQTISKCPKVYGGQ